MNLIHIRDLNLNEQLFYTYAHTTLLKLITKPETLFFPPDYKLQYKREQHQ